MLCDRSSLIDLRSATDFQFSFFSCFMDEIDNVQAPYMLAQKPLLFTFLEFLVECTLEIEK